MNDKRKATRMSKEIERLREENSELKQSVKSLEKELMHKEKMLEAAEEYAAGIEQAFEKLKFQYGICYEKLAEAEMGYTEKSHELKEMIHAIKIDLQDKVDSLKQYSRKGV